KSGVWDYFTRLAGEKAECKLCPPDTTRKRVFDTPKKTTGSLHNHLRSYHKLEHSLLNAKKNLTGKRARKCAEFLAEHPECSPAMFHSQTFLSFFPENEWSTFPSRTSLIETIIPKMISEVKETNKKPIDISSVLSIFQDLAGVPGCIVADGCTSKGGKVSLTAVLFYYIADDFSKMEGPLLAVKKTTGRHTADAIRALLEEV
ncbi:hypothetical protein PENTCL1PPCAC_150, partial [Pristionchus entomophagus]